VPRTAAPTRERLINADQHPTTETSRPVRHDLELRGISRSFGGVRALEDVSISVRGGEVLALIGPNGSGKTTVINVITGMYRAAAGSVLLDGVEITRLPARRIALNGVARTFQTPKTFPALSIAEHLSLASSARGATGGGTITDPELWVRRVLNLGGIDVDDRSVMRRETRELSHGQLRFLEIAMAIRRMPRVLLLDEPAAGLSPKEIAGLEAVTRELADAGIGVLFVEHHLDLVTRLADQVVVLDLGRVIWKGKPDQLHESDAVKTAYLGVSS
jgi:ABC-type branched-subunit amino acid transport system ATPase component